MSNEGFPVHDARLQTLLAHLGREPSEQHGFVNPAIQRGSTVLFDTIEECEDAHDIDYLNGPYTYGLLGTPVERQLERALAILDKGEGAVLFGSGLAAVTTPLTANLKAGDHLLMTDTCYWPTRQFCDDQLSRLGIETTYYDPLIGADIEQLMRPNTRVLFMESPGSSHVRSSRCAGHDQGGTKQKCCFDRRQYLGNTAPLPSYRTRCGLCHPCAFKICRWTLRSDAWRCCRENTRAMGPPQKNHHGLWTWLQSR